MGGFWTPLRIKVESWRPSIPVVPSPSDFWHLSQDGVLGRQGRGLYKEGQLLKSAQAQGFLAQEES